VTDREFRGAVRADAVPPHGAGPRPPLPPAIAAEVARLYPWQQRLFWAALSEPRQPFIARGRRNGVTTVRRLIGRARELLTGGT